MIEIGTPAAEETTLAQGDSGRAAIFARLSDRQLAPAYRLAAVLLGSEMEAQDAIQDAAATAWERFDDLRDPDRFGAWFQRIIVNVCRDRLRRRGRVRLVPVEPDVDVTGPDATAALDEREALKAALADLGPDQRTVVVLRYFADLPLEAIAERTGEPLGTVKSRLHYGLRALRAAYEATDRLPEEASR